MHKFLIAALLSLPVTALADENCKHSQPRDLQLELAGVKAVVFEIGPHELKVDSRPGASAAVHGRACASEAGSLEQLKLTQQKVGDKLLVRAARDGQSYGLFFGRNYAYMELSASLPDDMPVQLKVGSGDAEVTGAPVLSVDVGSGDVLARGIRGLAAASVGSGDINFEDVGSLQVFSIGSGDVGARQVRGDAKVGSIGSGDFELDRADGDVEIGSIGSGDADLRNIAGSVSVGSVGSGSVDARDVGGDFTVRSSGSGSLKHSNVSGRVDLPRKR
ncbi:DUF4097 family beta strand repeat-containing protein [Pseudoxanthomonas wuyuanensis]